jgi:hypothetical protein
MDKPNCKICGKAHWSHEDHVWPNDKAPEKSKPEKKKKFDRVAYQREYMRKRRMKIIKKDKGTPRGEAHRIESGIKELPYEFEDKEYEMEHFVPDYSPAKPGKKRIIGKQKKREYYK